MWLKILFGNLKSLLKKNILITVIIVLLLALALQTRKSRINQDILNAFVLVDEGLVKTTANFTAKNETIYNIFDVQMEVSPIKVKEFRSMSYRVKDWADQLIYDIQELKVEIIKSCDGDNAPSLMPVEWYIGEKRVRKSTFNIDGNLISRKGNIDIPSNLMIINGKGQNLKEKIENYKNFILSKTYDPSIQKFIMDALNTEPRSDLFGTHITWEAYYFEHLPMIAVIANLSKIQNDIRNAEAEIIIDLLTCIGATDTRVNRMMAVVVPKSTQITKGDTFEALILLAAYDTLQKPRIIIGPFRKNNWNYELVGEGDTLTYDAKGRAIYRAKTTKVGNFTLQGIMQVATPEGLINYPFSYEYQVGEFK